MSTNTLARRVAQVEESAGRAWLDSLALPPELQNGACGLADLGIIRGPGRAALARAFESIGGGGPICSHMAALFPEQWSACRALHRAGDLPAAAAAAAAMMGMYLGQALGGVPARFVLPDAQERLAGALAGWQRGMVELLQKVWREAQEPNGEPDTAN